MITSKDNPKIKQLRSVAARKRRDRSGLFAGEGEDLLAEALRRGMQPQAVFYDEREQKALAALLDGIDKHVELHAVDTLVLASASALGSGSRVICLWDQRWSELGALSSRQAGVYLHEVSDPGNVGTVIRAAMAFDAAVALGPLTADPFGPKAVRASMGAVFGVPIVRCEFEQAAAVAGLRKVALVPRGGRPLREASAGAVLFVLGSEREGLPDRIASSCDEIAHVPMISAGADSLNVAMTATLCLYENLAHRLPTPPTPSPTT
ncbi:MAG: RNA methyltransferase [Solirubrobacterales bacterium]